MVAGYGMAAHRLVVELRGLDRTDGWRVLVLGGEPRAAYDRVALSSLVADRTPEELTLPMPDDRLVDVRLGTAVVGVDRAARVVVCADGARHRYDALVLATGSAPFVPPVPGRALPGCHTYRTVEDVDAIRDAAMEAVRLSASGGASRPERRSVEDADAVPWSASGGVGGEVRPAGVVIGGGLLGLEAAGALRELGMRTHVLEIAPHLMPLQVDAEGGRLLAALVRELGIRVHCGAAVTGVFAGADGRVRGVALADGRTIAGSVVVFSAGIRPHDELAASAGLAVGERGGFLVDDRMRTEDPRIWAIGECAAVEGRCHGLVAPSYRMAESVARQLLGLGHEPFRGADFVTRLKLLGTQVTSFGDVHARTDDAIRFSEADRVNRRYRTVVVAADGQTLLGEVEVASMTAPAAVS